MDSKAFVNAGLKNEFAQESDEHFWPRWYSVP